MGSTPLFFPTWNQRFFLNCVFSRDDLLVVFLFQSYRSSTTRIFVRQTWRHAAVIYPFQGARGKCGPVALSPHFCLRAAQCELLVMVLVLLYSGFWWFLVVVVAGVVKVVVGVVVVVVDVGGVGFWWFLWWVLRVLWVLVVVVVVDVDVDVVVSYWKWWNFPVCHVSFQGCRCLSLPQHPQLDSGPDHLVEAGASQWPSWEGWEVESCFFFI